MDHLTSKLYGGVSSEQVEGNLANPIGGQLSGEELQDPVFQRTFSQYHLDEPFWTRFGWMIRDYAKLNFGKSYFQDVTVLDLIKEKLPVSISLGLWATVVSYILSLFLGIYKARREGSRFDLLSSVVLTTLYAMPSFLLAVALIVLFAGGHYFEWFPLQGLVSENFDDLPLWAQVLDYLHHITLPFFVILLGSLATLSFFTKSSFLDEMKKQYVLALYARGGDEKSILYGHILKNVLLTLASNFPQSFIKIFFTSNLVVEIIFSLDGMGLLIFESSLNRDYPVVFGSLFVLTAGSLFLHLINDLCYQLIDPRVHFKRGGTNARCF